MNHVVVFGGGTGLSCLLSGLKLFPVDVTTVITVTDNGSSTGKLKEELDIPAVGDIGKVLLSMASGKIARFRKLWIRVLAPPLLRVIYPLGNRAAICSHRKSRRTRSVRGRARIRARH